MLLDQKVKVKWNGANRKYYENLGYVYSGHKKEFSIELKHLSKGSHSIVIFQCDYCDGKNQLNQKDREKTYKNLLSQRKSTGKDCCNHVECTRKKMKETTVKNNIKNAKSLSDTHPHLVSEWSSKNKTSPSDYTFGSEVVVWWNGKCGHEWQSLIRSRAIVNAGCPYCAGKKICLDNCLATTHPDLSKEWHPTKNDDKTPYDISKGSQKKVWWLGECNHEWEASISHRVGGKGCPYCSGKKVNEDNCLDNLYYNLSKEWHPAKNGNLTPHNVTAGSQKKVWWICENEHEWEAVVSSRVAGNNCPYCAGRKADISNCLATLCPELTLEWNCNKNGDLTPYNVTKNSNKKVWWICSKCSNEWESTISNRTYGNNCPKCSSSKGEILIEKLLKELNIKHENQYKFEDCKNERYLPFDFAIFNDKGDLVCIIEYDGQQHFQPVDFAGKGEEWAINQFNKIKERDKIKNQYCIDKNIPLLRIPYWKFNDIEKIIIEELNKYSLNSPLIS